MDKDLNHYFIFTITINILIATAMNIFSDKVIFLADYSFVIARWYGIAIIALVASYTIYLMGIKLDEKEGFYLKKRLLISVVLAVMVLFASIYPSVFYGYSFIVIVLGMTFNFIVPILDILIPLVLKIIKVKKKFKGILFIFKKN
ncbi:MAG: hypothetical protein KC516_04195 [Nanoarchaeota archaeon]|nr:hypothetical protein [Nanoarchaeota archaeon]